MKNYYYILALACTLLSSPAWATDNSKSAKKESTLQEKLVHLKKLLHVFCPPLDLPTQKHLALDDEKRRCERLLHEDPKEDVQQLKKKLQSLTAQVDSSHQTLAEELRKKKDSLFKELSQLDSYALRSRLYAESSEELFEKHLSAIYINLLNEVIDTQDIRITKLEEELSQTKAGLPLG